jgi:PmbA protein
MPSPRLARLKSLAETALRMAHSAGARHAEASVSSNDYRTVEAEKGEIKKACVIRDEGVSIRVLWKGGFGQASTVDLSAAGMRAMAADAVRVAKFSGGDPRVTRFALPGRTSPVDLRKYDPAIAKLPPSWLVASVDKCLAGARRVDRRAVLNGGAAQGAGGWWVANSEGVSAGSEGTIIEAGFTALVRRGEDAGTFYDYSVSRSLDGFHPVEAVCRATAGAARYLNSRNIDTATLPVILGPQVTGSIIGSVAYGANAESVQFKRSFLAGKLGEAIASPLVTLEDDGLVPGGAGSSLTDGEGVPKGRTEIISQGRLATYLYNNAAAMKDGVEPTGHGTRGGGIAPGNLRMQPGRGSIKDLIGDTGEGIYIETGSLSPHPVTGAISATIDFGFKVERGRLAYPLKTTMLGGQVQEWLLGVDAVSAEVREDAGTSMPAIRIKGVRVAGAGRGK